MKVSSIIFGLALALMVNFCWSEEDAKPEGGPEPVAPPTGNNTNTTLNSTLSQTRTIPADEDDPSSLEFFHCHICTSLKANESGREECLTRNTASVKTNPKIAHRCDRGDKTGKKKDYNNINNVKGCVTIVGRGKEGHIVIHRDCWYPNDGISEGCNKGDNFKQLGGIPGTSCACGPLPIKEDDDDSHRNSQSYSQSSKSKTWNFKNKGHTYCNDHLLPQNADKSKVERNSIPLSCITLLSIASITIAAIPAF